MRQLSFPGFNPPPRPSGLAPRRGKAMRRPDRLFLGILLDADVALSVRHLALRIQRKHRLTRLPRPTALLHISLHWLGDHAGLPEGLVGVAANAASTVNMPAFEVSFDRVMNFERTVVLVGDEGVIGLKLLQQELGEALAKIKLGRPNPHFKPHVTLIYDETKIPAQPVAPIRWRVRDFTLIHSLVGRGEYIRRGSFTLRD